MNPFFWNTSRLIETGPVEMYKVLVRLTFVK